MTDASLRPVQFNGYHAHIYYDTTTRSTAERLAEAIGHQFSAQFGSFFEEPVGPHPISNLQIIFTPSEFQELVPWLMTNREGLDVLIHPLTDDSVNDHSRYALWLGRPVSLKLSTLRPSYRHELLPTTGV